MKEKSSKEELIKFGIWFAQQRESAGYESQRQLALDSGVSTTTISRIESGIQKAEPKTLHKLAPFLKLSYEELLAKAGYLPEPEKLNTAHIPEDYAKKYKVTRKDLLQYEDFIQHAGAFFMDDKVADEDKEALFRDISELFWKSKEKNKQKYGRKKKKEG